MDRAEAEKLLVQAQNSGFKGHWKQALSAFREVSRKDRTCRLRFAQILGEDGDSFVLGWRQMNCLSATDPAPSPVAKERYEEALHHDPLNLRARGGLARWHQDDADVKASWTDEWFGRRWANGRSCSDDFNRLAPAQLSVVRAVERLVRTNASDLHRWCEVYDDEGEDVEREEESVAQAWHRRQSRLSPIASRLRPFDAEVSILVNKIAHESYPFPIDAEARTLISDAIGRRWWLTASYPSPTGNWVASSPESGSSYADAHKHSGPPPRPAGYSTRKRSRP